MTSRSTLERIRRFGGPTLDILTFALLVVAVLLFWSRRDSGPTAAAQLVQHPADTSAAPLSALDALQQDTVLFPDGHSSTRLVLLFRSDCAACASQLSEWLTLVQVADSAGIPTIALTPEPLGDAALSYFSPTNVQVLQVKESAVLWTSLKTRIVPTTLIVGPDREVRFRHHGVMTSTLLTTARDEIRAAP